MKSAAKRKSGISLWRRFAAAILQYILVPVSTNNRTHILRRVKIPAKKVPVENHLSMVGTEDLPAVDFYLRPACWAWIVLTRNGIGVVSVPEKLFGQKRPYGTAVDYQVRWFDNCLQIRPIRGAVSLFREEEMALLEEFFEEAYSTEDDSDRWRKTCWPLELLMSIKCDPPKTFYSFTLNREVCLEEGGKLE